jgi:hypothetical protein
MAYRQYVYKYTCGNCHSVRWRSGEMRPSFSSTCNGCNAHNELRQLPQYPDVPLSLYLGAENSNVLRVYPVPPEQQDAEWADPYSVRSFVYQAAQHYQQCSYSCDSSGTLYGQPIFKDTCHAATDSLGDNPTRCSIMTGWSSGGPDCGTWHKIKALCQTAPEQRFLQDYIRYVKDRQFPMLLPQARVGIAERRRPDFVIFIPVHFWNFKKLAIQLDGSHVPGHADDKARDAHVAEYGYETMSVRPDDRGYLREVQRLVEHVDILMQLHETDPDDVATETTVRKCTPEIPF